MSIEIPANPFFDDDVDDSYLDPANLYLVGGGVWINEHVVYGDVVDSVIIYELEREVMRMPQRRHDLLDSAGQSDGLRLALYLEPSSKNLNHHTDELNMLHVPDANPLGLIVPDALSSYQLFIQEQGLQHRTHESEDAYIAAIRAFSVFQVESIKALNIMSPIDRYDRIQRLASDALNRSSMGFNSLGALYRVAPYESEDQWMIYAMVNVVAARSSRISPQARFHAAQVIAQMRPEANVQFFSLRPDERKGETKAPLHSIGFYVDTPTSEASPRPGRIDAAKGIRSALRARLSLSMRSKEERLFDQYLTSNPSLKKVLDRHETEENRLGFNLKSFVDEVAKKRPREAVLVGLLLLSDEESAPYGLYMIGELGRKGDSKVFGFDKKYWEYIGLTEE